jgi:magnesium chelatase family protein
MTRLDFSDVRAIAPDVIDTIADLVIARAPFLLIGPPGVGKTMVARRCAGLLSLDEHTARWLTIEYQAVGLQAGAIVDPPFRAPHHTISAAAVRGATQRQHTYACPIYGSASAVRTARRIVCTCGHPTITRAGEAALARGGVLFLDELPEFPTSTIEATREALDRMGPRRGAHRPLVIASANPCPCGWHGSGVRECACTGPMMERWAERLVRAERLLGIADRVRLPSIDVRALQGMPPGRSTAELRAARGVS